MRKVSIIGILLAGAITGNLSTQVIQNFKSAFWMSTMPTNPWSSRGNISLTAYDGSYSFVEIDPSARYQSVDGFGGCFNEKGWEALNYLNPSDRSAALAALFDPIAGSKFNICRVPIGASDYALSWYSLNETPDDLQMQNFSLQRDRQILVPFIRAAMEYRPDLKVWGSAWSPPVWMKEDYPDLNMPYAGGRMQSQPSILSAYALYLEKFVLGYRSEGINMFAVAPQNEPSTAADYPSCLWAGSLLRDFIKYYLGPRFREDRVPAEIWLGTINASSFDGSPDYGEPGPALSDDVSRSFLTGVMYQYSGLGLLDLTREAYPDLKLMQSEANCGMLSQEWGAENSWNYGVDIFRDMVSTFNRGVSSYMQWNMVLDETGASAWGWRQNSMLTVNREPGPARLVFNPQYYAVKHLSFFVQPGAYRINSIGASGDQISFMNLDGSVVLALYNKDEEQRVTIKIGKQMFAATLAANSYNTFLIKN